MDWISLLGGIATAIPKFVINQRKLWKLTRWEATLFEREKKLDYIQQVHEFNLANIQNMIRVEVERVTAGVHWKPQPALKVTFVVANWSIFKIYWDKFISSMKIDWQGMSYDLPPYLEKRHLERQSRTNFEITYPLPDGLARDLLQKSQEHKSVHFEFTGYISFRFNSEAIESNFSTSHTLLWP